MKYFRILVASILLLQGYAVAAQEHAGVIEHTDARLDSLVKKHNTPISCFFSHNRTYPGYSVLVASIDDRDMAKEMKTRLVRLFPDQYVGMSFQAPYFKLKLGEFSSEKAAAVFAGEVSKKMHVPVSVVNNAVSVKPGNAEANPVCSS